MTEKCKKELNGETIKSDFTAPAKSHLNDFISEIWKEFVNFVFDFLSLADI